MSLFIGLLSGTSVDSIDAAVIEFNQDEIRVIESHEQPFSSGLRNSLQTLIKSQNVDLKELSNIDSLLAFEFSQTIDVLLNKAELSSMDITAIGSHGQTIYHQPNGNHPNTIQIGCGHKLAANTGINVVTNFRNLDMAYGGQGAPLAPLIHQKLFSDKKQNTAVINLGGIANISFVGKDYPNPCGFDIGPANCLLDEWITIHKQLPFDHEGNWAKQGKLNKELLKQMLEDKYFQQSPPKSTGREYFNRKWYNNFKQQFKLTSAVDIQASLTHLTAVSISQAIKAQAFTTDLIVLMGGGAKNLYMINLIEDYTCIQTKNSDSYGYDPDWIESILFAYLAYKRINNQKLDLSSFTGSNKEILVGDIIVST